MFPNAKIIVYGYHFVRQMYWAVEGIQKEKRAKRSTGLICERSRKKSICKN